MVELAIQYDAINDICPSHNYDQYALEVSLCGAVNLNSTSCDVEDISSISTLYDHTISVTEQPSQRRLIRSRIRSSISDDIGFEIYVLMTIYAQDQAALYLIEQLINSPDFVSKVEEQWKNNEDGSDSIGDIISIFTEDNVQPPTSQPASSVTATPTTSPSLNDGTDTGYVGVASVQTNDGVLGVGESIIIVVGSALLLAFCLVITRCCCLYNPKHIDMDEEHSQSEGLPTEDERDLVPISREKEVYNMDRINDVSSMVDSSRALRGRKQEENVLLQETDEEDTGRISPLTELDQILVHREINVPEDSIEKVLNFNGIAEFESSTSAMRALPAPVTPGAQVFIERTDSADWRLQKGPIISQIQAQKVQSFHE